MLYCGVSVARRRRAVEYCVQPGLSVGTIFGRGHKKQ